MSLLAILGGAAAVVGVFLSWGEVTGAKVGGEIFGQQIPSESLSASDLAGIKAIASLSFNGLSSFAGILLLVGGVIAVLGGLMCMTGKSDAGRRTGGMIAAAGGVLAVAMAVLAFFTRGSAGVDAFFGAVEEAAKADPTAAAALGASGVDMGQALDFLRDFVTVETSIGIGFWISVAGAVVAVLAGLMMLGGAKPAVAGEAPAAGWTPPSGGGFVPDAAPPEPMPPAAPESPAAPETPGPGTAPPGDQGS